MFQVNGEKKEKKSKKKGMERAGGGWGVGVAASPTLPQHHPELTAPGAA